MRAKGGGGICFAADRSARLVKGNTGVRLVVLQKYSTSDTGKAVPRRRSANNSLTAATRSSNSHLNFVFPLTERKYTNVRLLTHGNIRKGKTKRGSTPPREKRAKLLKVPAVDCTVTSGPAGGGGSSGGG